MKQKTKYDLKLISSNVIFGSIAKTYELKTTTNKYTICTDNGLIGKIDVKAEKDTESILRKLKKVNEDFTKVNLGYEILYELTITTSPDDLYYTFQKVVETLGGA